MNTLLICHADADINRIVIARWLASFSHLTGIILVQEAAKRRWRRVQREVHRIGPWRFIDVAAFRLYYRLFLARADHRWQQQAVHRYVLPYPELPADVPLLYTTSPNSAEAEQFIRECAPDLMLVRCKHLLKESVFLLPALGTFVMHPGICPEYRNSHGCFWALARNDLARVGMTLLRIDRGIDTGPIYGYYSCQFDEVRDSHLVIQQKVVLENLTQLAAKLREIADGKAIPIDISGRESHAWGQPWLSSYLTWKRQAKRREHESSHAALPRCGP